MRHAEPVFNIESLCLVKHRRVINYENKLTYYFDLLL